MSDDLFSDIIASDREEKKAQDARNAESRRQEREQQRIPEVIAALPRYFGPLDDQTADERWLDWLTILLDALKDSGKAGLLDQLPPGSRARLFTRRSIELLMAGARLQALAPTKDVEPLGKLGAELARERSVDLPNELRRLLAIPIPHAATPPSNPNGEPPATAQTEESLPGTSPLTTSDLARPNATAWGSAPLAAGAPVAQTSPIPAAIGDALITAARQEIFVLGILWNAPATGTDWNAGIFKLLELWRNELPDLAPPEIPEASNYREAQRGVDVFLRAVEAAGGTMQPVGSAAPASIKPVQGEQSPSDQLDRFADPTRCPDPACNAPVPELYKQQSSYVCRACGCWRLHTGIITMPVAGPPGTRPEYIRASAPFWQTTNAQPAATPTANAPGGDDRPEVKAPPPADGRPLPPARHSKDFRSVHWYGDGYSFTPTQAHCIKVLWEAWENGTPDVGQETILEHPEVEAESRRLADVFKGHPAWGKMIVKGGTAGAYRLANPPLDN